MVTSIESMLTSEVYTVLGTRAEGLSRTEVQDRLQRFGPNILREIRGKSLLVKLLANFVHLMAILLWTAGLVALVAQMPQLAISIWTVNIINGAFSFWQEYKAEKATEAMRQLLPVYASVLRDNTIQRVQAQELIPGDVILLTEGDRISADARLSGRKPFPWKTGSSCLHGHRCC